MSRYVKFAVTLSLGLMLALASVIAAGNPFADNAPRGGNVSAQEVTTERGITVSGQGRVAVVPDTARATIGVQTQNDDLEQALTEANSTMESVIQAIQDQGVPEEQIQTATFVIQVERDHEAPTRPITGYTVVNRVEVSVSPLEQIAEVIEAAVGAGANDVGNVTFTVEDNEQVVRQAREQAMDDARQRAEHLAELGGVTLGAPIAIQEGAAPSPPAQRVDEAPEADLAPPIQPGEEDVTVIVTVTYAIE